MTWHYNLSLLGRSRWNFKGWWFIYCSLAKGRCCQVPGLLLATGYIKQICRSTASLFRSSVEFVFWYFASIHKLRRNVLLCNSDKRKEIYNGMSPLGPTPFCTMERTLLSHPWNSCLIVTQGPAQALESNPVLKSRQYRVSLGIVCCEWREKPFSCLAFWVLQPHLTMTRRIKVLSSPEEALLIMASSKIAVCLSGR